MTTVRVPVRVRLELAEDRAGEPGLAGLVGSAVAAAAGRVMDRARGVQAVGRSASGDVPYRFSICFAGDPLPSPAAAELEASIRTALWEAAAGLRTRSGTGPELLAAATGSGEERDEERVVPDPRHRDGDAYLVPSYHQHGQPAAVTLRGGRAAAAPRTKTGLRLRYFTTPDALHDAVVDHFGGHPPTRLITVSAATTDTSGHGTSLITLIEFGDEAWWILGSWTLFIRLPPAGPGPSHETGSIVFHADSWRFCGSAPNRSGRVDKLAALVLDQLQRQPGHGLASAEHLQKQAMEIAQYSADEREGPGGVFALFAGEQVVWAGDDLDHYPPAEDLPAMVFSERADLPVPPAYGSDCRSLEPAAAHEWFASFGLTNPNLRAMGTAFLFEPPIASFPPAVASELYRRMSSVADQLHFQSGEGEFVGGFLISAMTEIDRRCRIMARTGRAIGDQLVEIARAFGDISGLTEFYLAMLVARDQAHALHCPLAGQAETWRLHFLDVFLDARDDAVGSMFVSACQDRLLQVLIHSRKELDRRLSNLDAYVRLTRVLLLSLLADTPRLTELRQRLKTAQLTRVSTASLLGLPALGSWHLASDDLLTDLEEHVAPIPTVLGTVRFRNGAYRVLDDTGRWWSAAELDLVLSKAREQALRVDPFLEKLSELPELVEKLRNAERQDEEAADVTGTRTYQALKAELQSQFYSVLRDNDEYTKKAAMDRSVAFGLATFKEREGEATIAARMSGIYQVADEFLRPAFTDQEAYIQGVGRLADEEIGRESAKRFFELIGMTLLAVFFPEVALVVGALQVAGSWEDYLEHRDLQHAMIGGDEILSKAQVEAEFWSATIGTALLILPEIPGAARGAGALIRGEVAEAGAVIRGEAAEAAGLRRSMTRITAQLAEASLAHFATEFVKELTKMYLINLALSRAMGAIAQAVEEQARRTGEVSLLDLPDVVARAIAGPP